MIDKNSVYEEIRRSIYNHEASNYGHMVSEGTLYLTIEKRYELERDLWKYLMPFPESRPKREGGIVKINIQGALLDIYIIREGESILVIKDGEEAKIYKL